jgi:hypothetical protein
LQLDKDKIKESLTEEEIHKILKELGSKDPIQGNQYQTVCHGWHKHKLYYYHDTKSFHCYTDCSDTFDIYELVIKSKRQQGYNFSLPQAIQYIATLTGKLFGFSSVINKSTEIIDDWNWINRHKKKEKITSVLPEYDSSVLDVFLPYPHESWLKEGIGYGTMKKFEIGYYIREEKISIIHRDINGRFIGIRGRSMNQEDIENGRKYMPLTIGNQLYNHQIMFNLYGLHKTKEAIKNNPTGIPEKAATDRSSTNLRPIIFGSIIGLFVLIAILYFILVERPRLKRRSAYYKKRARRKYYKDDDYLDL